MAEKILDYSELSKRIETLKSQGKKVVLADGCFDLLHVGHVRYLRAAKALGDILVLALNSDESVKRVKGEGRPLLPLEDRLGVLSAFEMVDFLTSFKEDTVEQLLLQLKPQIYAKRSAGQAPGKNFEGQVFNVQEGKDHTADKLIQEILRKYGSQDKNA
jgi:rfaE bifunctional protein nucleotidyltransferase chain/domain